jgi:hypothetical protein
VTSDGPDYPFSTEYFDFSPAKYMSDPDKEHQDFKVKRENTKEKG